ncbi:hypothetical protein HCK45_003486 [Salmonella enterica]|uniref:hypothetical protein n=1 Tax=Salmonella enterica TaxID=28901 RepID=UPI00107B683A|nr:hypothetical protein [Salmonella enterica]EAB6425585.1 hypothetical protein [Salmonella enterica subsp. enterica serovar Amsterdam]EDT1330964.1 hypothetical protein [Salmonella enterica subsp. enterica serovar Liverpool]ECQ7527382.1 hypothetical protein [Salmonella enterica]EEP7697471.1 hypothetical protein [Salmonella enterica]EJQ7470669.1 hypothetical protein [Salmonella enterica]
MCSPAIALAGASVALSGVSAYNQYQQGKYSSAVAEQNAEVATAQAQDSINRGNAQADEVRRRNRQAAGSQAATMGATGADLSTGNALDIFGDTAQFGTLDALTTVNNAQREAYGYQVQSANYDAQAVSARKQGNMGVMTTLLTTPLQAYGAYQMAGGTWSPFSQKAAPISAAVGTPTGR